MVVICRCDRVTRLLFLCDMVAPTGGKHIVSVEIDFDVWSAKSTPQSFD